MWTLFNRTVFAADRNWTRDKQGVHWWIVAVRASCHLAPDGRLRLADEQVPPVLAPEYFGAPGQSSLRYDSDLLAVKPGTDLLLLASAHAPGGQPAPSVAVGLRVGPIRKQLVVHGERVFVQGATGVTTTAPRPFITRPIRYELAFGGRDYSDPDPRNHRIDERNPVGRGFAVREAQLVNTPAHSIEYPGTNPASTGPAGFGPVDPGWLPRRRLAGTYDDAWARGKKPLLPDDYDPAYALSSPVDQRLPAPLAGGERVELLNLTPGGRLIFEIPRVRLEFTSIFGRRRESHPSQLAAVLVEPDEMRLSIVWQSTLRVPAPEVDYLDGTEIVERRGAA
jgi:hypothetical protein